jgi:hypothetical protein
LIDIDQFDRLDLIDWLDIDQFEIDHFEALPFYDIFVSAFKE